MNLILHRHFNQKRKASHAKSLLDVHDSPIRYPLVRAGCFVVACARKAWNVVARSQPEPLPHLVIIHNRKRVGRCGRPTPAGWHRLHELGFYRFIYLSPKATEKTVAAVIREIKPGTCVYSEDGTETMLAVTLFLWSQSRESLA